MTTMEITEAQAERANELEFYRDLYGQRAWSYDVVSGAQIKVVLGENVILEDCTAIQYTLTQSKKPIFGYASRYYDAVAGGIVIVHGRLWINFIHQGYLRTLLDLAARSGSLDAVKQDMKDETSDELNRGFSLQQEEDVVAFVEKENRRRLEVFKAGTKPGTRPDIMSKNINIQINYGDRSRFSGVPEKVLYDIHFIGEGQDIQISGQPQQEWYEFLAQRVT